MGVVLPAILINKFVKIQFLGHSEWRASHLLMNLRLSKADRKSIYKTNVYC